MKRKNIDIADLRIEFSGIELLQKSLSLYFEAIKKAISFKYILDIKTEADSSRKLIFKIVSVRIQNVDQAFDYGSLTVSCIFHLKEFEKLVNVDARGVIEMPRQLATKLDADSVSTLRGIMFSEFKGTILHNAILPVMDF